MRSRLDGGNRPRELPRKVSRQLVDHGHPSEVREIPAQLCGLVLGAPALRDVDGEPVAEGHPPQRVSVGADVADAPSHLSPRIDDAELQLAPLTDEIQTGTLPLDLVPILGVHTGEEFLQPRHPCRIQAERGVAEPCGPEATAAPVVGPEPCASGLGRHLQPFLDQAQCRGLLLQLPGGANRSGDLVRQTQAEQQGGRRNQQGRPDSRWTQPLGEGESESDGHRRETDQGDTEKAVAVAVVAAREGHAGVHRMNQDQQERRARQPCPRTGDRLQTGEPFSEKLELPCHVDLAEVDARLGERIDPEHQRPRSDRDPAEPGARRSKGMAHHQDQTHRPHPGRQVQPVEQPPRFLGSFGTQDAQAHQHACRDGEGEHGIKSIGKRARLPQPGQGVEQPQGGAGHSARQEKKGDVTHYWRGSLIRPGADGGAASAHRDDPAPEPGRG